MNTFSLLRLYRSLTRHKLYSVLNIGSLAVGIAVFLVLGLYVRFETSFEKWLPDHDKIYLVQTIWHIEDSPFNGAFPNTMGGLLEQIREDFPGTVGTRIMPTPINVIRNGVGIEEQGAQVDPEFFDVFALPMVAGNGPATLNSPSGVLIDQDTAEKYFGTLDAVGQTLTLTTGVDGKTGTYTVGGVFQNLPENTDLNFKVLGQLPAVQTAPWWYRWGSTSLFTYLRFPTPAAAQAFNAKLDGFVNRRGMKDLGPETPTKWQQLAVLPITAAHLTPAGGQAASLSQSVIAMGVVGVIALLIAMVNYINLATARAGLRAREVAMSKVLGANRNVLIRQFIGEAVLLVALAALVGLSLAELALPWINAATEMSLAIPYALAVPALAVLALVVGIAAGFYPAVLLARYPAASVLASARAPGGGRAGARVRELLVMFQFALAISFMVGTLVLAAQTAHVRSADVGFKRDGLIVVRSMTQAEPEQIQALTAGWRALPMIHSLTLADNSAGGSGTNNANSIEIPGQPGPGPSLQQIVVGPDFFRTYGARLLAGREFDLAHGADDFANRKDGVPVSIVINRMGASALGFASPEAAVGKTVGKGNRTFTIIGVIDNMRFLSPRDATTATYYSFTARMDEYATATLRYSGDLRTAMDAVKGTWLQVAPQVPFDASSADQRLAELYKSDEQATRLFTIGAVLAVLIGCVGLWGLASFNTVRRVKEIGIRKTLGASTRDIVLLLVGQFLRPVVIANLIAWPLAWVALRNWLAGFSDPVVLSPLYFVAASVLALLIAALTVSVQSLRAARAIPAWALRHD
ncbi:transporter [Aurantiacibacter xanthus]|uniref:Transporter n=1 Tax=Aurantiacibacter xanthus TaxID=1784712 RepID=A0A3A1P0H1_9SPHN|nr:FtsX-like permease family protein [Aurantiacibacter xanthus]RIV82175.1 transporter [Aurantiacibacter xanthus]